MNKIRDFLIKQGFELWDADAAIIDGMNKYLRICVLKEDDKYLVRNAIMCYFDRWANSGVERIFDTEDEVIEYFAEPTKCLTDAINELINTIIDEAAWDKDYTRVDKMINLLYSLLN